jgi:hypothetical protein
VGTEHFARNYQGVSHAKWPKELAPAQTVSFIRCALDTLDIEFRASRAKELSKRAKKP